MQKITEELAPEAAEFVLSQIKLSGISPYARRYNAREKRFALTLKHCSQQAYNMMSKVFVLPSKATLERAMKDIDFRPGMQFRILM